MPESPTLSKNEFSTDSFKLLMQTSDNQLENMINIFAAFGERLSMLERNMLPIYNLTEKLRLSQKNIDRSIQEILIIQEHFQVNDQVKKTVQSGPNYDLSSFVEAVRKLQISVEFLESNRNFKSSRTMLPKARSTLETAIKLCSDQFKLELQNACNDPNSQSSMDSVQILARCLIDIAPSLCFDLYLENRRTESKKILKRLPSIEECSDFESATYEKGSHPLIKCINILVKVLEEEQEFVGKVISSLKVKQDFHIAVVTPIMDQITKQIETGFFQKTATVQQPTIERIFISLDILDVLRLQQPKIIEALSCEGGTNTDNQLFDRFTSVANKMTTTMSQMLISFRDNPCLELPHGASLSKDGIVHPTSCRVVNLIRALADYLEWVNELLKVTPKGVEDSTLNSTTKIGVSMNNPSTGEYVGNLVVKLMFFLEVKAQSFKWKPELCSLFLLNNFNYIKESLNSTQLGGARSLGIFVEDNIMEKIEKQLLEAQQSYLDNSWSKLLQYLVEPTVPLSCQKGSSLLTLESGRVVKAKFTGFNSGFDELFAAQVSYSVPDPTLRENLIQMSTIKIIPAYTKFYEKFSTIQFSKKNATKYLKYTPSVLGHMLKQLYSGQGSRPQTK